MAKKITYSEPADFIPKSVRKQLGLGEFAPEPATKSANDSKKASTPKKSK